MEKLSKIASRVAAHSVEDVQEPEMELVFTSVNFPVEMTPDEALQKARLLMPCKTGAWELEQHEHQNGGQWMVGNLECEQGFYDEHPRGFRAESGGVRVEFETP